MTHNFHPELGVDSPRCLHNIHETIENRSFLCPLVHSPEKIPIYLLSRLLILCSNNAADESTMPSVLFNWCVWVLP